MSIWRRLRNAFSSTPSIDYGSGDQGAEAEAAIEEELPVAAEDEAGIERVQAPEALRGAYEVDPGIAAFEEAESESEDTAPDSHS